MSNDTTGLGIAPVAGPGQEEGNVTTHLVDMDLPNGKTATVGLKIGHEAAADREAQRQQFLLTVHPASLTDSLERDIARLTEQYNDFNGYDKEGKPVWRVQGKPRELLEMKLANRHNGLRLAQRERALAERAQADAKAAKRAADARIEAAASAKAQELIEQAEVDRRAKQIAARSGVRS